MGRWNSGGRCGQFLRCVHDRRYMKGEDTGGTHDGVKRRLRHILGYLWVKSCGKRGGGNRTRGTQSMIRR